MRINKYLASCGLGSRRSVEQLIVEGKVVVSGNTVRDLAFDVDEKNDKVYVSGKPIKLKTENVYYMLNKPKGVISAASSDHGDKTVVELIGDSDHRIFPVGRLDKDSEGLIFLTNDGDFAYTLTHPKFMKPKKYIALLKGMVDAKDIKKLSKGVTLDDGVTVSARSIKFLKPVKENCLLEIVITEGRNRQIRRMCEIIGHPVLKLKRVEEAGIELGALKPGEFRELTEKEVAVCFGYKEKLKSRKNEGKTLSKQNDRSKGARKNKISNKNYK